VPLPAVFVIVVLKFVFLQAIGPKNPEGDNPSSQSMMYTSSIKVFHPEVDCTPRNLFCPKAILEAYRCLGEMVFSKYAVNAPAL